jgi:hypothetical protein
VDGVQGVRQDGELAAAWANITSRRGEILWPGLRVKEAQKTPTPSHHATPTTLALHAGKRGKGRASYAIRGSGGRRPYCRRVFGSIYGGLRNLSPRPRRGPFGHS